MGKGALQPGLGVSKELGEVGDISITGIVGGAGNHDPVDAPECEAFYGDENGRLYM